MLAPGGTGAAIDEALNLAAAAAGQGAELVVVSDGGVPEPESSAPDARWVLVGAPEPNVAVVKAEARSSGGTLKLFARVSNFADTVAAAPIALMVDGDKYDEQLLDLDPNGSVELVWALPNDAKTAEIAVAGDDAAPLDDSAVVPLQRAPRLVQLVGDPQSRISQALSAMPGVEIRPVTMETMRTDGTFDATVIVAQAPDALPPGGVILVDPPPGDLLDATTTDATSIVESMDPHPLNEGLDFSGAVLEGHSAPNLPPWAETIIPAGGAPAVFAGVVDGSRVVVLAFDPERGTISERLGFPIFVARAIAWSAPTGAGTVLRAGEWVDLPPARFEVESPSGLQETVQGHFEDTREPGMYVARSLGTGPGRTLRFAVHAGDATESDLRLRSEAKMPSREVGAREEAGGRRLWTYLVGLALLVVLAEGILRRVFRESRGGRST